MNDSALRNLKPVELSPLGERPLVSVLVANYNYARFLPEALESALNQTYSNLEVIVCDDGSTDDSCRVVEHYAEQDARVRLERKSNGGVSAALNAAYAAARGDLIALLDADDVWLRRRLERVVLACRNNPQAGMITHYMKIVDASGNSLGRRTPVKSLSQGWCAARVVRGEDLVIPAASALTVRREIAERVFPLPQEFRQRADSVFGNRAALLAPVAGVSEVLGLYRLHGRNITASSYLTKSELEEAEFWNIRRIQSTVRFAHEVHGIPPQHQQQAARPTDCRLSVAVLNGTRVSRQQIAERSMGLYRYLWMLVFMLPQSCARWVYKWWRTSGHLQYAIHRMLALLDESWKTHEGL